MPIEVKEIQIKVSVEDNTSSNNSENAIPSSNETKEQIISACVEQVLQILKDKEER